MKRKGLNFVALSFVLAATTLPAMAQSSPFASTSTTVTTTSTTPNTNFISAQGLAPIANPNLQVTPGAELNRLINANQSTNQQLNSGGFFFPSVAAGAAFPDAVQRFAPGMTTTVTHGPMELIRNSANAVPVVVGVRDIMTNGHLQRVAAPIVTEYVWPEKVAMVQVVEEKRSYARVVPTKKKTHLAKRHYTRRAEILK